MARQRFKLFSVLLTVSLGLLSGCATVQPLIRDFNIVSLQDETALGQKMSAEVAASMPLVSDPALNQKVNAIGSRLVAALPSKPFDYHFYVVKDPSPNAFTIPGGRIYIHTGLLQFADDEEELAGVMAHEIGHAQRRHPAKGLSRTYGLDYLSGLLFKENKNQLQQMTLSFAKGTLLKSYGREDEREADEVGFYLMQRAGYSPDGLIRFFKKLAKVSSGGPLPAFLSTHPPTPERIQRLEGLRSQNAVNRA